MFCSCMKSEFGLILALSLLTFACTSRPVGLDDEAGVTTAMGESTGANTDEAGSTTPSEESTSDDASATFVPIEEDLSHQPCDSFAQDCPPGEKCVPFSANGTTWDDNKCVPIMGDQQVGETCWWGGLVDATDNCDASSICWNTQEIAGELIGTCLMICQGTADTPECPPMSSCIVADDGPIAICMPICDPLVQDCGEGLACYWSSSSFNCIATSEDLATGEPCGFINDCAAGNFCVDGLALPSCMGAACCTPYCDLQLGDADCLAQPGTACVPFFEPGLAPPAYENLGLCVVPG